MKVLLLVFELLVVVAIVFIAVSVAQNVASDEGVAKKNIADEVKLMVHTLVGVPGDANVRFPFDNTEFDVILTNKKVAVFKQSDNTAEREIVDVILPEGWQARGEVSKKNFCIDKVGEVITLLAC